MRLLVVQHLYAWSYQETVQRVADSLVLRWFCRVYFQHVPVATTFLRWAATIQPATLHALNDRVALLAKQARVTQGRKLRLDSTCVQTAIHHPTDSGLLVDGVRVLTRLLRQAKPLVAQPRAGVRDAFRSRLRTAPAYGAARGARRSGCIACDDGPCQRPPKPRFSARCIRRCCRPRSRPRSRLSSRP
jgi:IS5 family transposase